MVSLTNGDVDHVAGLLTLRERQNLEFIRSLKSTFSFESNSIFNVLNPDYVDRREMKMNNLFELTNKDNQGSGIMVEAFEVPGKIALWLEDDESKVKILGHKKEIPLV